MAKFHKVEAEIEAYQLPVDPTEDDNQAFHAWADEHGLKWESDRDGAIVFYPLAKDTEVVVGATGGDWLIKHGRFAKVSAKAFEANYVRAPSPASMLKAQDWETFRKVGLLWWVNRMLHLFGWALVFEVPDGQPDAPPTQVYPAKCKFRGFGEESEDRGFKRLTAHLRDTMPELLEAVEDE